MARTAGGGYSRVFKALRKALEDGNSQVAVQLIDTLQGLHVTGEMLPTGSVTIEQKPMETANPVDKAPESKSTDAASGSGGASDSSSSSSSGSSEGTKPAE